MTNRRGEWEEGICDDMVNGGQLVPAPAEKIMEEDSVEHNELCAITTRY